MDTNQAKQLLWKYSAGECTQAEKELVENSFLKYNEQEVEFSPSELEALKNEVYAKLPIHKRNRFKTYLWTGAAAALLVAILTFAHLKLEESLQILAQSEVIEDVAPIGNRALLTLGGKSVSLNGAKNGLVISGGSVKYLDGTKLENELNTQMSQTLSTPKGGQYQVVLSDGTKVWLNAASSISYPSSFVGAKERRVSITGEAYFEVARDRAKPFIVAAGEQQIRVLGTHFNVNAYGDGGKSATTLLEGSVSVSLAGKDGEKVLKPLQCLVAGNGVMKVGAADVEQVMAWKNGVLEFKDASIGEIMNEVSRWYDLEVEYRGDVSGRVFNGSVSRKSNLSVLLKILSYSDIHFKIEMSGDKKKRLIVEP